MFMKRFYSIIAILCLGNGCSCENSSDCENEEISEQYTWNFIFDEEPQIDGVTDCVTYDAEPYWDLQFGNTTIDMRSHSQKSIPICSSAADEEFTVSPETQFGDLSVDPTRRPQTDLKQTDLKQTPETYQRGHAITNFPDTSGVRPIIHLRSSSDLRPESLQPNSSPEDGSRNNQLPDQESKIITPNLRFKYHLRDLKKAVQAELKPVSDNDTGNPIHDLKNIINVEVERHPGNTYHGPPVIKLKSSSRYKPSLPPGSSQLHNAEIPVNTPQPTRITLNIRFKSMLEALRTLFKMEPESSGRGNKFNLTDAKLELQPPIKPTALPEQIRQNHQLRKPHPLGHAITNFPDTSDIRPIIHLKSSSDWKPESLQPNSLPGDGSGSTQVPDQEYRTISANLRFKNHLRALKNSLKAELKPVADNHTTNVVENLKNIINMEVEIHPGNNYYGPPVIKLKSSSESEARLLQESTELHSDEVPQNSLQPTEIILNIRFKSLLEALRTLFKVEPESSGIDNAFNLPDTNLKPHIKPTELPGKMHPNHQLQRPIVKLESSSESGSQITPSDVFDNNPKNLANFSGEEPREVTLNIQFKDHLMALKKGLPIESNKPYTNLGDSVPTMTPGGLSSGPLRNVLTVISKSFPSYDTEQISHRQLSKPNQDVESSTKGEPKNITLNLRFKDNVRDLQRHPAVQSTPPSPSRQSGNQDVEDSTNDQPESITLNLRFKDHLRDLKRLPAVNTIPPSPSSQSGNAFSKSSREGPEQVTSHSPLRDHVKALKDSERRQPKQLSLQTNFDEPGTGPNNLTNRQPNHPAQNSQSRGPIINLRSSSSIQPQRTPGNSRNKPSSNEDSTGPSDNFSGPEGSLEEPDHMSPTHRFRHPSSSDRNAPQKNPTERYDGTVTDLDSDDVYPNQQFSYPVVELDDFSHEQSNPMPQNPQYGDAFVDLDEVPYEQPTDLRSKPKFNDLPSGADSLSNRGNVRRPSTTVNGKDTPANGSGDEELGWQPSNPVAELDIPPTVESKRPAPKQPFSNIFESDGSSNGNQSIKLVPNRHSGVPVLDLEEPSNTGKFDTPDGNLNNPLSKKRNRLPTTESVESLNVPSPIGSNERQMYREPEGRHYYKPPVELDGSSYPQFDDDTIHSNEPSVTAGPIRWRQPVGTDEKLSKSMNPDNTVLTNQQPDVAEIDADSPSGVEHKNDQNVHGQLDPPYDNLYEPLDAYPDSAAGAINNGWENPAVVPHIVSDPHNRPPNANNNGLPPNSKSNSQPGSASPDADLDRTVFTNGAWGNPLDVPHVVNDPHENTNRPHNPKNSGLPPNSQPGDIRYGSPVRPPGSISGGGEMPRHMPHTVSDPYRNSNKPPDVKDSRLPSNSGLDSSPDMNSSGYLSPWNQYAPNDNGGWNRPHGALDSPRDIMTNGLPRISNNDNPTRDGIINPSGPDGNAFPTAPKLSVPTINGNLPSSTVHSETPIWNDGLYNYLGNPLNRRPILLPPNYNHPYDMNPANVSPSQPLYNFRDSNTDISDPRKLLPRLDHSSAPNNDPRAPYNVGPLYQYPTYPQYSVPDANWYPPSVPNHRWSVPDNILPIPNSMKPNSQYPDRSIDNPDLNNEGNMARSEPPEKVPEPTPPSTLVGDPKRDQSLRPNGQSCDLKFASSCSSNTTHETVPKDSENATPTNDTKTTPNKEPDPQPHTTIKDVEPTNVKPKQPTSDEKSPNTALDVKTTPLKKCLECQRGEGASNTTHGTVPKDNEHATPTSDTKTAPNKEPDPKPHTTIKDAKPANVKPKQATSDEKSPSTALDVKTTPLKKCPKCQRGEGANGRRQGIYWRDFEGYVPKDAIIGGYYVKDSGARVPIYLAHAFVPSKNYAAIQPGQFFSDSTSLTTSYLKKVENVRMNIEVLCGDQEAVAWLPAFYASFLNHDVDVIRAGFEKNYNLTFARSKQEGKRVIGKAAHRGKIMYLPYKGREIAKNNFDVLCYRENLIRKKINFPEKQFD